MNERRSLDQKMIDAYPDTFDIIKVTTFTTAGDIIKSGSIIKVTTKDASSDLPLAQGAIGIIEEDVVLVGTDEVILLGYKRNYSSITMYKQTFASDLTSVIVAGEGKNMSLINSLPDGSSIFGFFNKIQIPATSTDTVILAYRS